jgi:hypothetical protein
MKVVQCDRRVYIRHLSLHNPVIQGAGKIAVVHRGSCEFLKKVDTVQKAGGIAMVLVNDGPGLSRMATASQWESAHVVEPNTAYIPSVLSVYPTESQPWQCLDSVLFKLWAKIVRHKSCYLSSVSAPIR